MSEIEALLKADENNSRQTKRLFNDFDPELYDSFDDLANIFQALTRSFGCGASDGEDLNEINEIAQKEGLDEVSIIEILKKSGPVDDDQSSELYKIVYSYYSRRARGLLILQTFRSFMYASTDLFRLRVTSALGQLRVEIEAVALMNIFQSNNKLSHEGFNIRNDEQGRTFFFKTKKQVNQFCQRHDLEAEWNLASSASQHARFVGLIDGLSTIDDTVNDRYVNQFQLALQDFNSDQPEALIIRALYVLRTQGKLLLPIEISLPEVNDPLVKETRIPMFHKKVARLYDVFSKKFPQFMQSNEWGKSTLDSY